MISAIYQVDDISIFTKKALQWASLFKSACCLHSQGYKQDPYSKFDIFIAAGTQKEYIANEQGTLSRLQAFLDQHENDWIPGFMSYDLKNELENLNSQHQNEMGFPLAYFFIPEHCMLIKGHQVEINSNHPDIVFKEILSCSVKDSNYCFDGQLKAKMTKEEYVKVFNQLLDHIHRGDIYEINLCQEFYAENCYFTPLEAFWKLSRISPTPFSLFFKQADHYIVSASPERFLAKRGQRLISQPIKGTAPRGSNGAEDQRLINALLHNKKEISENIMIVDLVRNDLTRSAIPATVKVEELMGLYSFKQVHQLISTITCQEKTAIHRLTSLRNTFPAGSMTGAPKISAMRLIDRYERSNRGIYAGSVGYFAPDGDYDFNVIIRTLLYNAQTTRLSFQVGSAITADAEAVQEFEECQWKAKAMMEVLA